MKKLFFNLIALVAFSAVSMANTLAFDENRAITAQNISVVEPCMTTTFYYYNGVFIGTFTVHTPSLTCSGVNWVHTYLRAQKSVIMQ